MLKKYKNNQMHYNILYIWTIENSLKTAHKILH